MLHKYMYTHIYIYTHIYATYTHKYMLHTHTHALKLFVALKYTLCILSILEDYVYDSMIMIETKEAHQQSS